MLKLSRRIFTTAPLRTAAALCLAGAALAACGGGGYGGGGSSTPPPTVSISVSPASIVLGQSATLTWSSSAGSNCTASGGWSGAEPASGNLAVTPTATGTVTYTLACGGTGAYGGSTSKSTQLTVTAPTSYTATTLVGDTAAGGALTVDAKLVNPWGIAFGPTTPAWVANNHSETSTLYDGNGKAQPTASPIVANFAASASGTTFDPTGVVFSGSSTDFVVTSGANSGPARFIFVGEGGMVAGWSPNADRANAITTYTDAGGAVYKGVALANNGTANFLYATDFHNGKVDVFDATFAKQTPSTTSFAFTDPTLPAGYAPFGIQALPTGTGGATQLYITYAQQSPPDNHDNANGAGLGLVDIFDTNGNLVTHLIQPGGKLNAPWGLALAPADFGTLGNSLLVGNFGDGTINAYDPATGAFIGTVSDSTGAAFAQPGLWGIAFGNGANNQPKNTLFWAAGLNDEANGAYGRIDAGGAPTLNAPPVVAVTTPAAGNVTGAVTVTATAQDSVAIAKVEFFAGATSLGVVTTSPYSVQWDTSTIANGTSVTLTATATDVDGNVGTSPGVTVTVGTATTATTLSQIQTDVFTPICSGCHNGVGTTLPGVQNLTAGHSFASIVGVASIEQPTLMRVKPGDAANSYLIQKLEGTAGTQMPLGGPPLPQATIDKIKAWINSGAPNN
jgi:uncharacterized protein (TIGR03118 family)